VLIYGSVLPQSQVRLLFMIAFNFYSLGDANKGLVVHS